MKNIYKAGLLALAAALVVCIFDLAPIRNGLVYKAETLLPSPQSSLLVGMLLGQQKQLPASFKKNLRRTGTVHVVVVSGYNITVVAMAIKSLLDRTGLSLNAKFVLIEAAIGGYVLLVGGGSPAIRSFVMLSLLMIGKFLGRERRILWIVLVSGFLMILINPKWINDISFQFSYLATLGLILYANYFKKTFSKLFSRNYFFNKIWFAVITEDLSTTLAAQVLVWPLASYYFGQISLLSPIVNVAVLWTVPVSMLWGSVLLAAALIWPGLASFLAWFVNLPLSFFVAVVTFFGQLPFSSADFKVNLPFLGFYYLLVIYLAFLGRRYMS